MTLPPAAAFPDDYWRLPLDGPRRWLCHDESCNRPARWGDATGPMWCDQHKSEHVGAAECTCSECGHTHLIDLEPEHYPEVCPECGSDDTGRGIRAMYCDTCGASWMADAR